MSRLVIELTGVPVLHCTLSEFLSPDEMNQLLRLKMQRFAIQLQQGSPLLVVRGLC